MTMRQRVLITGASGYIGRPLFERLKAHGWEVVGTRLTCRKIPANDQAVAVDLRDRSRVRDLFDRHAPETIVHLAALAVPAANEQNPRAAFESHIQITENVIACMPGGAHLVFLSTDKVFDGSDPCPNEESTPNPSGLYGQMKLLCERLIAERVERFHIFRLPTVHALGDPNSDSFIDRAIERLKAGDRVEAFDNVQRCFARHSETIEFLEHALTDRQYGLYHAGSRMMSYYDRVMRLCEESGIDGSRLRARTGKAIPPTQNLNTQRLAQVFGRTFG